MPGLLSLGEAPPTRAFILNEMSDEVAHGFLDLYDPEGELRGEGLVVLASRLLKSSMRSLDDLRSVLENAARMFDVIVIDTFTAFSMLSDGASFPRRLM